MEAEIKVYWEADGTVFVDLDDQRMAMDRQEAEQLFIDLGHTLQDMDIEYWKDKTGDGTEQPV